MSLSIVFRTFKDVLRCAVLHARRAAYCVPFRFACAGNSESGMVHSIRFHGFRYARIRLSRSFVTQHPRAAVLDC